MLKFIFVVALTVALFALVFLGLSFALMVGWNAFAVGVGFKVIDFNAAMGGSILLIILRQVFGGSTKVTMPTTEKAKMALPSKMKTARAMDQKGTGLN